jgi:PAS domain S-box-containing protein
MNLRIEVGSANKTDISSLAEQRASVDGHPVESRDPPALQLDERGVIQDCNETFEMLYGFRRNELVWCHISSLLPQFTDIELVQAGKINPLLNYLCHCGHLYRMQNPQGETVLINLNIFSIRNNGKYSLRLIVQLSDIDAGSLRH